MALATTCPLCKTSFKVVPDQLKLSRGSVRCGVCQNVFSGIDHLRYVDQSALKGPSPRPAGTETDLLTSPAGRRQPAGDQHTGDQPPAPDKAAAPGGTAGSDDLKTAFFLPDTGFGNQVSDALAGAARTPKRDNDFSSLPRIPFSPNVARDQSEPTPADFVSETADGKTGSEQHSLSESGTAAPAESVPTQDSRAAHETGEARQNDDLTPPRQPKAPPPSEPVVRDAAREVAPPSSGSIDFTHLGKSETHQRQPFALVVVALLLTGLLVQAVIGWRNDIAARSPQMSAALESILDPLGFTISPPLDLSALSIESFELQTGRSADILQMTAILRNRSSHVVGFPAMELTLTDSSGALLSRKVIRVESYLDTPLIAARGLAGRSEWPLRIALEHDGLAPAGYSVALFYP